MTKSGGEIAQGKAKDAGGLTPAKDDNAALRDCYSRTFAGNSDDCYRLPPYVNRTPSGLWKVKSFLILSLKIVFQFLHCRA